MPYNPDKHHRRSIRLDGYDYTQVGAYFVTLCVQHRRRIFGVVRHHSMHLSDYGVVADEMWQSIPDHFPHVVLDAFVVMPDHVHGIIVIMGRVETRVAAQPAAPLRSGDDGVETRVAVQHAAPLLSGDDGSCGERIGAQHAAPLRGDDPHIAVIEAQHAAPSRPCVQPGSLGAIVRSYKSAVTQRVNAMRGTPGAILWQRNYYERIIRDEKALHNIRRYIINNPRR